MRFENLSPEMKEKVRACESGEELAELAEREGYDLTDEQVEAIYGGDDDSEWYCSDHSCPYF